MSRKKVSGTVLQSTDSDPLREELDVIFSEYPDGAAIAYGFLTTESSSPYIDITESDNIWRVRRDVVDRCIDGVSDRITVTSKIYEHPDV